MPDFVFTAVQPKAKSKSADVEPDEIVLALEAAISQHKQGHPKAAIAAAADAVNRIAIVGDVAGGAWS